MRLVLPRAPLAPLALFACLSGGHDAQNLSVLASTGDLVGLDGTELSRFDELALSPSGTLYSDVQVSRHGHSFRDAVLRDGRLIALEGRPLSAPSDTAFLGASDLSTNAAGALGWAAWFERPSGLGKDQVLYWNASPLVRKGALVAASSVGGVPLTPGTEYAGFNVTRLNDRNEMLVAGFVDEPSLPGGESFAAIFRVDAAGRVVDQELLAVVGYPLPSSGETVDVVIVAPHSWAFNASGQWLGEVVIDLRSVLVMDGAVVARTGVPSQAYPPRYVQGFLDLDLNDRGDRVALELLGGRTPGRAAIVVDSSEPVVATGDTFPAIAPWTVEALRGAPVRITNDGAVFWQATLSDPSPESDRAYFRSTRVAPGRWEHEVLVREGVTRIGDRTVGTVYQTADAFDVTPNGRSWVGKVTFVDRGQALVHADLTPAVGGAR